VRNYADAGVNMSKNPYRDGFNSYRFGSGHNPYQGEFNREQWQAGFDAAEAADAKEQEAATNRRDDLWNVPERAKDAYIAMEDDFCPQRVLYFMIAMYPEASE
jgi:hypothetical protein